jgi:hypothetical protein
MYNRIGAIADPGGTLTIVNDTTLKMLASFPLAASGTDYVRVLVTMYDAGTPDGATFELRGAWYRVGGAPVAILAPTVAESSPNATGAGWTAVLALNGNNVEVRVQINGGGAKTVIAKAIRLDQERQG